MSSPYPTIWPLYSVDGRSGRLPWGNWLRPSVLALIERGLPILVLRQSVGLGDRVADELGNGTFVVRGQTLQLAVDRRGDVDNAPACVESWLCHGESCFEGVTWALMYRHVQVTSIVDF